MALLSKSCIYGIRASIFVAIKYEEDKYLSIPQIANELQLSSHFLTKILQKLTIKEILLSYRGPNGGVKLKNNPEEVKLLEIIEAIDGLTLFEECALGLEGCGMYYPCPLHYSWSKHRESLMELFERETLKSLADSVNTAGFRLRTLDVANLTKVN
ncbi:Rrf2 family transcriptional regulator [Candidatus Kapabacteria bacterium]|nr:Rrf2 family transcriptional regulator [Candidatus Kapabacteria bacterium]